MILAPLYREHRIAESGRIVDLNLLMAEQMTADEYSRAHSSLVIPTHDAVITYNGGIVLLERDTAPLKGFLWTPGGRVMRGVPAEVSLKSKVKAECGLEINNLQFAGVERAFMAEDPFGHDRGTDTLGLMYFADGSGELSLDTNHRRVFVVKPKEYDGFRDRLHSFITRYTDEAIARLANLQVK